MIHLININELKIPSLALATLKTLLRHQGVNDVRIHDVASDDPSRIDGIASALSSDDIVGFTATDYNLASVFSCAQRLRAATPSVRILCGGPIVSSVRFSTQVLERHPEIDLIVRGRANSTFPALICALLATPHAPLPRLDMPNLTFRSSEGIRATPDECEDDESLMALSPWLEEPEYLLDRYLAEAKGPLPYGTGYGCPRGCTYCAESHMQFMLFPLERIKEELSLILEKRPERVFVYDSVFGYNRTRGIELMRHVAPRNRGTVLAIYVNLNDLDEEYLSLAKEGGFVFNGVGLQTVNEKTCSTLRRPTVDTEALRRRINTASFQAISDARVSMIYGLPGEGYDAFLETLEFALSLQSNNNLGLYRYCYYPGTHLYEEDLGYEAKSETDPEIVCGSTITRDEVKACNRLAFAYSILISLFPHSLAFWAHLRRGSRAKLLEGFSDRLCAFLEPAEQAFAEDVSFANKETQHQPRLDMIKKRLIADRTSLASALAEAAAETMNLPEWPAKRLERWIGLDYAFRGTWGRWVTLALNENDYLAALVAGLQDASLKEGPEEAWGLGRRIAGSRFRETLWYLRTWLRLMARKVLQ